MFQRNRLFLAAIQKDPKHKRVGNPNENEKFNRDLIINTTELRRLLFSKQRRVRTGNMQRVHYKRLTEPFEGYPGYPVEVLFDIGRFQAKHQKRSSNNLVLH